MAFETMIDRSTGTARADRTGSNWIELLAALLSTVANLLIYAIYRDFMGRESSQIISNHLKSCCLKPIAAGQPHFTFNSFCSLHRDSRPMLLHAATCCYMLLHGNSAKRTCSIRCSKMEENGRKWKLIRSWIISESEA